MTVLCCGDRNWKHWPSIWSALRGLGPLTVIVHGGAGGADRMCGYVGKQLGYEVVEHFAEWGLYGNAAGPIRNQKMLDEHRVELVLAFHDDISTSKGTADMVRRARAVRIPVNVVRSDE